MRTWTLADVMNREVLTVRESKTVEELAAFLSEKEISGVPVVDRRGKLVGVVSVTDIVEQRSLDEGAAARAADEAWEEDRRIQVPGPLRKKGGAVLVRDIMTPTVYTIPGETTVAEAARTMIAGRIHRLFVTSGGHVAGIVTTLDLLRLLVEEQAPAVERA
jgi:CBS domain-containing protein